MRKVEVPSTPRPLPEGSLYFVGIGGAGMSALAYVLAERGRTVAGSDPGVSPATRERLESVGVTVYAAHDASQVGDATVVVVSDAIPEANPEVLLAQEKGIPIFRRPEVLAAIVNAGRGIAIAGTHGKTTTTGMVASILLAAGLDPTILIGGDLPAIGGNARNGKGDFVVAESCEAYDGFLYLHPEIAVVLNLEADHLDYHGTEAHVIASFERFVGQVRRPDGKVVLNRDDERTRELWPAAPENYQNKEALYKRGVISAKEYRGVFNYSLDGNWPLAAKDIDLSQGSPSFSLYTRKSGIFIPHTRIRLKVPGLHNVSNALAAAQVALLIGISEGDIKEGLEAFTGTGRRFEKLGEVNGVLVVDDYAHHPTEIRATLAAARSAYPDRRLIAVFQPHLPSRTRDNMDAFSEALAPDAVYLTDIYLAREQPLAGITSDVLVERIRARNPQLPVVNVGDKNDLPARLAADVRSGDIVLVMGAGDIRKAGEGLLKALEESK